MTDHPCKGMSKTQVAAFERVAINEPPMAGRQTMDILEKRGLVERLPDKFVGRDVLGVIRIAAYCVPLPVHMQWCQWCSEQSGL